MANDRIFMVCKKCGKQNPLLKYYPGCGLYLADPDRTNKFLEEHQECYGFNAFLDGAVPFKFYTESLTAQTNPQGDNP